MILPQDRELILNIARDIHIARIHANSMLQMKFAEVVEEVKNGFESICKDDSKPTFLKKNNGLGLDNQE